MGSHDWIHLANISNLLDVEDANCTVGSPCDYSSDEFCTFCFINYGIVMTILVICGLVGNVLSATIFLRPKTIASFNYYLVCMAIWDSMLLLSSFLQFSIWTLRDPHGKLDTVGPQAPVLKVAFVLINTALSGCVWVVTCVTIERYRAIANPLLHMTRDNVAMAKKSLVVISFLAILFNIPRNFEMQITEVCSCTINGTLASLPAMLPTDLNENLTYYLLYRVVGGCGFVFSIPCAILIVLTAKMCLAIHKATKMRRKFTNETTSTQSGTKPTDSNSTNRTLVIIVIKFLLCYSLITVLDVFQVILPTQVFHQSASIERLSMVSNNFVVLNSSTTNFLIYYIGGKNFRKEFARLFGYGEPLQLGSKKASTKLVIEKKPLIITPHSLVLFEEETEETFL